MRQRTDYRHYGQLPDSRTDLARPHQGSHEYQLPRSYHARKGDYLECPLHIPPHMCDVQSR